MRLKQQEGGENHQYPSTSVLGHLGVDDLDGLDKTPASSPPSPPLGLRAAAPKQRAAGGQERTADPRRSRVERHAAHAQGWESGGRASSAGRGGMSGAVGMLTMRCLQAPARHKPGIEQHQRRALWPPLRETASYLALHLVHVALGHHDPPVSAL